MGAKKYQQRQGHGIFLGEGEMECKKKINENEEPKYDMIKHLLNQQHNQQKKTLNKSRILFKHKYTKQISVEVFQYVKT